MPDLIPPAPHGVVRRRVTVSGRVQGVWFRDSCRREAEARRVAGWVRNCPDGRVEAAFEGPAESVEALVTWCGTGPLQARIVHVEVFDEMPTGTREFTIR